MSGNSRSLLRMIESRAKTEAEAEAETTVARELALTAADAALGSALKICERAGTHVPKLPCGCGKLRPKSSERSSRAKQLS